MMFCDWRHDKKEIIGKMSLGKVPQMNLELKKSSHWVELPAACHDSSFG
jgi:hypothetical protein